MKLETENGGERNVVSPSDITGAFANPSKIGEFAILARQPMEFLQAAIFENGDCVLEYREGESGLQFQATKPVDLAGAEAAFLDYFNGGTNWKEAHDWVPLSESFEPPVSQHKTATSGKSGCASSVLALVLIAMIVGLALPNKPLAGEFVAPQTSATLAFQDKAERSEDNAERSLPTTQITVAQITAALQGVIGEDNKYYGLIAGVAVKGQPAVVGAVGTRKKNSDVDIEPGDKMHLGSCTKAMTATVAAMLIEDGLFDWNSTLPELLPNTEIHSGYQQVTFHQLVTHSSGLPRDPGTVHFAGSEDLPNDTARRKHVIEEALAKPPEFEPGSQSSYSNLGFITAGYILEMHTGKSWQTLMNERLFNPLEMSSAGFGPPAAAGDTAQPWGHVKGFLLGIRPKNDDNPSYYGPAGTVHMSLADWSKFAMLHLGHQPPSGQLITAESLEFLHTPVGENGYACGWMATEREWAGGTVYTHGGSNGRSRSVIWIAPKLDMAFMSATNSNDADLCDAAIVEMLKLCELLPNGN